MKRGHRMIQAHHTPWAEKVFHPYVTWLFKRHFHAVHLLGEVPDVPPHLPLLLLPNHSTWWDGFFVYLLNKRLFQRPAYLMMLERQLATYRFFSRIGAYSIDPRSPKGTLESLTYTVSLLERQSTPRPLICIFPQGDAGDLPPWGRRPLGYKRGVEWILRRYGRPVALLPLAIRAEFLGEQRPEGFLMLGGNYQFDGNTFPGVRWLEGVEEALLDQLASRIVSGERGRSLLKGARSVNTLYDRWTQRWRDR